MPRWRWAATRIQKLMGHKTLAMTLRYSHLAPAHKATAVARPAEALAHGPIDEPAAAGASAPLLWRIRNVSGTRRADARRPQSESTWKVAGLESGGGGNRTPDVGEQQ
jgi:hypothetical protein